MRPSLEVDKLNTEVYRDPDLLGLGQIWVIESKADIGKGVKKTSSQSRDFNEYILQIHWRIMQRCLRWMQFWATSLHTPLPLDL